MVPDWCYSLWSAWFAYSVRDLTTNGWRACVRLLFINRKVFVSASHSCVRVFHMKAFVMDGIGETAVVEKDRPEPGPRDAVLEPTVCSSIHISLKN